MDKPVRKSEVALAKNAAEKAGRYLAPEEWLERAAYLELDRSGICAQYACGAQVTIR